MKKILSLLLCCLVLAGCSSGPAVPSFPQAETSPGTVPQETAGSPGNLLTIYAPNEDATGFIYTSWEVAKLSGDTICGALIEAGVLNEGVAFNRLVLENRQIKLDVNEAFQSQLMSCGTAGEYTMVGSVVNTLLHIYAADTVFITCEGQIMESGHVVYDYPLAFYEDQSQEPPKDLDPMVMVDGTLYVDTGRESTVTARCGMMDGMVESQVNSWEVPIEDGQSNFGTGFGYQYGPEPGTIELNICGGWYVYAAQEE